MRPFAYGLAVRLYCSALLHYHNIAPLVNSFFVLLPLFHFALNQNLTNCLVWNPTDDYAYVNGRKTTVKCHLNSIPIFVNGVFEEPMSNGVYAYEQTTQGLYQVLSFSVTPTSIDGSSPGYYHARTLVSNSKIDVTNYDKVKLVSNAGTLEINTQNISGEYYVCVYLAGYENDNYLGICLSSVQQYFHTSLTAEQKVHSTSLTTISISEITVE